MPKQQYERQDVVAHLPLFGGEPEPEPDGVDPEVRIAWARRALLMSNLERFTAEDVRRFVEDMRPEYLGSGRWLGFVFRSDWFRMTEPEQATRLAAKSRWIWAYRLSDSGIRERRRLQQEAV